MKLKDVKDKIDAYFDNLDPMELVKQLESLGYEFEDIDAAVKTFIIYNWRGSEFIDLKYNHQQQVDLKDFHKVIDYFLDKGYNVMLKSRDVLYVDKGKFTQS